MSAPRKRALWVALFVAFVLVASAAATTGVVHFRSESAEEAAGEEADGDYGSEEPAKEEHEKKEQREIDKQLHADARCARISTGSQ